MILIKPENPNRPKEPNVRIPKLMAAKLTLEGKFPQELDEPS